MTQKPSLAVIGSGISGMAAAYLLHQHYDVTLFEQHARPGGHSRTKTITYNGQEIAVDTGFIVFNHPTYPHLTAMFDHLGVATEKSDMSFGFSERGGAFEWGASGLNAVFGQRSNLLKPGFYKVIADVKRFFRDAPAAAEANPTLSLGALLKKLNMGDAFRHRFIIPMGAAIWSCPAQAMLDFPALTFVRFFKNHGLLSLDGQHQWYTVTGGSQRYVEKLLAPLQGRIRLNAAVARLTPEGERWHITCTDGETTHFDQIIVAAHADEALAMLKHPTPEERRILSAFRYQPNRAYLHSDPSLMPKRRACWSSWNYLSGDGASVCLTYWMNRLQNIDTAYPLFVTLNPLTPPAPKTVFDRHDFTHPIFDATAIAAQKEISTIQGKRGLWFCGAYQRYGFHEDGLQSAVDVAKKLGVTPPWV